MLRSLRGEKDAMRLGNEKGARSSRNTRDMTRSAEVWPWQTDCCLAVHEGYLPDVSYVNEAFL